MIVRHRLLGASGVLGILLGGSAAQAQTPIPECNDPQFPNPVLLTGSSAFEPLLRKMAVAIQAANQGKPASEQVTLMYATSASCDGANSARVPQPVITGGNYYLPDPDHKGEALTRTCAVDVSKGSAGYTPAIGVSDVSFTSCPGAPASVPADIGEWRGPVQSMLIIVPSQNVTMTAISAEQAAAIWGCGAASGIPPFTDPNTIMQRSSSSGTQILVSKAIGVPPASFLGLPNSSGGDLVTKMLGLDPYSTIGFLAADAFQSVTYAGKLNAVAFRAFNQDKAYYADSDKTKTDKRNVRNGHYVIQGPLHFYVPLTAGQPAPLTKKVLDWITGAVPLDATKPNGYVDLVALAGDVPDCAMKVQQLCGDGGYFSSYTPPVSCGCYFENAATGTSSPDCVPCVDSSTCSPGKTCQTGYCE